MKHFIVTLFFSFLSSGNLQVVNNANNYQVPPETGMVPVVEDHIWPVQTYQTFRGNFYGTARRSIIPKPCLRHSNTQDVSVEQQTNNQFIDQVEQPTNNQFMNQAEQPVKNQFINQVEQPSPTRRSSVSETVKKTVSIIDSTNEQNQLSNEEVSQSLRSRNSDDVSDRYRSPEIVSVEETTFEIKNSMDSGASAENVTEENYAMFTPSVYEMQDEESYSNEVTTDHNVSPPPPPVTVDPLIIQSIVQCTNKKQLDQKLPETPRRFLKSGNHGVVNYHKTIMTRNKILRSDSINPDTNQANTYSSVTDSNSVTRAVTANPENQLRSQDENTLVSNDKTAVTALNTDEYETLQMDKSAPKERPLERSGLLNYLGHKNSPYNDPAKGQGISYVKKTTLMLMDYDRVCYACSTANNPTCLKPDRRTSVKYCRKGDTACVTKTFGSGSTLTLIRDCGRSCDETEIPGFVPKYKTCSICYADLCNSAYSINVPSLILTLPTFVLIVLVKPLL